LLTGRIFRPRRALNLSHSPDRQIDAVRKSQLAEDVLQMGCNGPAADAEYRGDFPGASGEVDEVYDFPLPSGQSSVHGCRVYITRNATISFDLAQSTVSNFTRNIARRTSQYSPQGGTYKKAYKCSD